MKLLALDTSTERASVALDVGKGIAHLEQPSLRQHAQQILPMIQQLLAQAHVTLAELDGIIFGSGPGSFTGLRIACSIAKALAYAHGLPIFGVCSLDAIAYQARQQLPELAKRLGVVAMLDARMQEVYWAYYPVDSRLPAQAVCVSPANAVALPTDDKVIVAGLGWELYQDSWSSDFSSAIQEHISLSPCAQTLIQLVQLGHIPAMQAAEALPIYVRNTVTQAGGNSRG